jgi:hypothetical protein
MAYLLSAQLAVMALNVNNGKVSESAMIYAPGLTSANALGFAMIRDVETEVNAELGIHGLTKAGSPYRAWQSTLTALLTDANNTKAPIFVQPTAGVFTF